MRPIRPILFFTSALALAVSFTAPAATAKPKDPPVKTSGFNVLDYGAKGDGVTKDTSAIARAIAACAAAGGGKVVFPKGVFLTGAIQFKSDVMLHLDNEDTVILFSTDPADYPVVFTRWEATECYNYSPLIYARDCERIAITGDGTIDGQGRAWLDWRWQQEETVARLRRMGEEGVPVERRRFGTVADALRPQMMQFISCRDVRIEGVIIVNSPFWTVHPVYCDDVTIRDVTIITRGPNTDGIDPESCKNVLIERCFFNTGDDCIAIKSGRDRDGRVIGRPSENITVRDCLMMGGHGIAIGSEMSGGVRHVRITNCDLRGTTRGIRLKSQRGRGGVVEDVLIENVRVSHPERQIIEITMHYGGKATPPEPFSERTPVFRNITFRGLDGEGGTHALVIAGLGESAISGVTFERVNLRSATGATIGHAADIVFRASSITPASGEKFSVTHTRDLTVDGRAL